MRIFLFAALACACIALAVAAGATIVTTWPVWLAASLVAWYLEQLFPHRLNRR